MNIEVENKVDRDYAGPYGVHPNELYRAACLSFRAQIATHHDRRIEAARYCDVPQNKPRTPVFQYIARRILGRLMGIAIILVTGAIGCGVINVLGFSDIPPATTKLGHVFEIAFPCALGAAALWGLVFVLVTLDKARTRLQQKK